jgi:hypothetical protein
MRTPIHSEPTWRVVHSREGLDPTRYLGELADLPAGEADPGAWCDVVVADSEGVMRWTLVVAASTPPISIVAARRDAASRSTESCGTRLQGAPCRPSRREGEVAPHSPGFVAYEPAAGTDGEGSAAGSAHERAQNGFAPAA